MESILIIPNYLPTAFGVVLLTFGLILTIAPYFSDHNFGIFVVPYFTPRVKKALRWGGPIFLVLSIALHIPIPLPQPGERVVYLSDLMERGDRTCRAKQHMEIYYNNVRGEPLIEPGDVNSSKGVYIHPKANIEAWIECNLTEEFSEFLARVNSTPIRGMESSNDFMFKVVVDDHDNGWEQIPNAISENMRGVKKLKLVISPNGSNAGDHAVFYNARFIK